MKKVLMFLLLLTLIYPVSAAGFNNTEFQLNYSQTLSNTAGNNISSTATTTTNTTEIQQKDVVSDAVSEGIDKALTKMGNEVYKQYGTERGFIVTFVTWNIHPEQIPVVRDFYQKNLHLAFPLCILLVLGTVISNQIMTVDPVAYTNVFGRRDFSKSSVMGGGLFMIIGLAFGLIFLGFMSFIDLLNVYLMIPILGSIAPSLNNGFLYFMMALIELLLSVFFIYRQLWIVAGYAISPLYGIMFASGYMKEFIDSIGDKFVRVMIMQPICILVTVTWIIVKKAVEVSPIGFAGDSSVFYVALFLILLSICWWCVFGKMTIIRRYFGLRALVKLVAI